jgi:hypothetical protein
MNFDLSQPSYFGISQMVATFLLRVSSLDTSTSVIFLLPESSASRDRSYQPIIPFRVKVKGATIVGLGTGRAEKAFAFADGCRTAKLQAVPLFFLTPINYLMASKASVATIFSYEKRV